MTLGYGSVKMKLNNIGTTIESLVPAGLCIQGLPARLCHWACMGIQLKFGRPTCGSRKWWEFFWTVHCIVPVPAVVPNGYYLLAKKSFCMPTTAWTVCMVFWPGRSTNFLLDVILFEVSTVRPCQRRGCRWQGNGFVMTGGLSKLLRFVAIGHGINLFSVSRAAGKGAPNYPFASSASHLQLVHPTNFTTTLRKIHHVGKKNTQAFKSSLLTNAQIYHADKLHKSCVFFGQFYYVCCNSKNFCAFELALFDRGPLVCLRYFHHDMIRWCSMHAINLGLCYGTNGGALILLSICSAFFILGVCPPINLRFVYEVSQSFATLSKYVWSAFSGWRWSRNIFLENIRLRTFNPIWTRLILISGHFAKLRRLVAASRPSLLDL